MLTRTNLRMDNATFLRWAEQREGRYELVNGQVIEMMAGATQSHRLVVTRVLAQLLEQLDNSAWLASSADAAVEIGPGGIRYPDIVVERTAGPTKELAAVSPTLIVEVLSPSSIAIDLGDKAEEYMSLACISDYLVLSQDGPKGWCYSRGTGPGPRTLTGRDVVVEIASIGVKLRFQSIYEGFPDWVEPEDERPHRR